MTNVQIHPSGLIEIHAGVATPPGSHVSAPEVEAGADFGYGIMKSEPLKKFTLGVAYASNKLDVSVAMDGFRDFAGADALEECAWNYLRKGRKIGLFHQDGTEGHAEVVESYIYRGPDWPVTGVGGDDYIIKSGYWMLGAVWDDVGFGLVENKRVRGWSPQGGAVRQKPSAATLAGVQM